MSIATSYSMSDALGRGFFLCALNIINHWMFLRSAELFLIFLIKMKVFFKKLFFLQKLFRTIFR